MDNISSEADLRKRIELLEQQVHALEAKNQFVYGMLDYLAQGIVVIRQSDAIIVETNEAMVDLFGYSEKELIGSALPSLAKDHIFYDHVLAQLQEKLQWQDEILTIDKDGTLFSTDVSAIQANHPIHDSVIVITFYNVEERYVYRNQYLSLVDTIPQLIYRSDLDGHLTFVNKAFQQALDIPFTDIIGRTLYQIYPYISAEEITQDDQRVINNRKLDHQRYTLLSHRTGKDIHLRITKVPIIDENDGIIGIQGIIEDVTVQTNMENQIKTSQATLQRLIQQMPLGIQVFDKSGLCIDANPTHLEIFGASYDEIVGKYNIFKDELAQNTTTAHAARLALQGDTVSLGDITFNFEDGNTRFANIQQKSRVINVTLFPMFDHNKSVTGFVGLNHDVTHRKMHEEQLRLSEARYRAIVQDQNEMINRYLPNGRLTFANRAFCELVGREEKEIIGQMWYEFVPEESRQMVADIQQSITQDNPTIFHEEEKITPDGHTRWVHWIDRGIFDDEGNIVEYQGIGIDITEKKKLEQKQFALKLEQERMKILSDFVIQASHEFRTPLSIINSSAFAMTRMADATQRGARLAKITKQVKRITDLIESMTIMSRIDGEHHAKQQNIADINKLIRIAHNTIQGKISSDTAQIILELSDDPLMVNIVNKDFVRVIELVTDNAIKHTAIDDSIHITTSAQENEVIITITDTGIGMDEKTRAHVFDRFFKADTSGKITGLGLGLPIARGITRQFGGEIVIESALGQGTTVTITFPQIKSA